jgi:hypothetical protein
MVDEHDLNRPGVTVCEIGSFNVNGSVRDLFYACDYTGIDRRPGPGVDIVAEGADWQPDSPVDVVVTASALEHTANPRAVIDNALAMLKPGGALILTTVGPPWGPHGVDGGTLGDGEVYTILTPGAVAQWLLGCPVLLMGGTPEGDILAFARTTPNGGAS